MRRLELMIGKNNTLDHNTASLVRELYEMTTCSMTKYIIKDPLYNTDKYTYEKHLSPNGLKVHLNIH